MIRFDLSIDLDYTVLTPSDFVFVIQPTNTPHQRVTWERLEIEPQVAWEEQVEGTPSNRHLRLRAEPGPLRVSYDAIVDLVHHFELPVDVPELPIADLPADVLKYVYPSRYCQSDRLASVAMKEFADMEPGYERVEAIRNWVQSRVKFQVGSSHASTSAMDTYESCTGVCRDFAHLMITMCRALNIPARYVVGYLPDIAVPDPGSPMDFCAWTEAYLGHRWYTFDPRNHHQRRIGRTVIARGRDAADVAMTTTFGHARLRDMVVHAEAATERDIADRTPPTEQQHAPTAVR